MKYFDFDSMPLTLTVRDVADTLAIGRNAAYTLVSEGGLPSVRIGNMIRIPREAFIQFLGGTKQSA